MGAIRSGGSGGGRGGGRGGGGGGSGGGGGGEIVPVQGGHILRSTGRKDRHSKVFTAKGPRDRRVRLAAHTAIQFYDVQDRLGYDRPSKAVDWLIKNAKSAIDKLTELPPWQPNPNCLTNTTHLVAGPTETPETPDHFVPEASSPIDPSSMEMVMNSSRSQDLGLSLHPYNNQQTGPGPKWGLGFGFERGEEFLYSDHNNNLASSSSADFHQRGALQSSVTTAFHGFDGYGGPGSEDQHKAAAAVQSMVQQSLLLSGRFGSDGFPGFCVPVISQDEGEDVGSSRAPSSFYAWSNGGHNSLLKNK